MEPKLPALVVFSGGTAFNSIAGQLRLLTTKVAHILPVSDDGGSTAEIVRVLGGPAVGDIRSRCLRLSDDSNEEAVAVRALLAHRLNGTDSQLAKAEWIDIVDGNHDLWLDVSEPYKHTIRAFLVYFNHQIQRKPEHFNFQNGSVGNFFFAGARLFLCSMEAAIFLFSRVARIPEGSMVLPAIRTEGNLTLGAELQGGFIIRGQNQISHPSDHGLAKDSKDSLNNPLPAPITRILYLGTEGRAEREEVYPPNPSVLIQLENADAVIYGIGSLFTSICPSLILEGVAEAIAGQAVPKILLLNGSHDRETSCGQGHASFMKASDVVQAICSALNREHGAWTSKLANHTSSYVSHVLFPHHGSIEIDLEGLLHLGISNIVGVKSDVDCKSDKIVYNPEALIEALKSVIYPSLNNVPLHA